MNETVAIGQGVQIGENTLTLFNDPAPKTGTVAHVGICSNSGTSSWIIPGCYYPTREMIFIEKIRFFFDKDDLNKNRYTIFSYFDSLFLLFFFHFSTSIHSCMQINIVN